MGGYRVDSSAQAIITGGLVYNGVHPWIAEADQERRENWKENLLKIQQLNAATVVAGHKSLTADNSVTAINFTLDYLQSFEAVAYQSETAEAAIEAMKLKYPNLALPIILEIAMKAEFGRKAAQN